MTKYPRRLKGLAVATSAAAGAVGLQRHCAAETTLTIESWRNDDADIWNNTDHPGLREGASRHQGRLQRDGADRIQRRAQLAARRRHRRRPHHLPAVRRLARPLQQGLPRARSTTCPGMENFSDVAKSAWTTDDGKTTFCVPMASVIHGFIYNKKIFDELKLHAAEDRRRVLRRPRQDQGRRQVRAARHRHRRPVGSRHHGLPEHRPELLEGRGRPQGADRRHGQVHRQALRRHLGRARQVGARTWATATRRRNIPTARTSSPSARRRSIRPARGTSPPSRSSPTSSSAPSRRRSLKAGDTCYISDHTDIGIGLNAKSTNADAAKTFLSWVASPEFAAHLRQRAARLLPALERQGRDQGPGGAGVRELARPLQVDDPQLLPDPVARHAEPRERALERDGAGDERHDEARRRRRRRSRRASTPGTSRRARHSAIVAGRGNARAASRCSCRLAGSVHAVRGTGERRRDFVARCTGSDLRRRDREDTAAQ